MKRHRRNLHALLSESRCFEKAVCGIIPRIWHSERPNHRKNIKFTVCHEFKRSVE
jgi:hypothetical protein